MKLFETPEMEIVKFAVADVIATSTCDEHCEEDYGFFDNPCIS